jgi:hypothetical protein
MVVTHHRVPSRSISYHRDIESGGELKRKVDRSFQSDSMSVFKRGKDRGLREIFCKLLDSFCSENRPAPHRNGSIVRDHRSSGGGNAPITTLPVWPRSECSMHRPEPPMCMDNFRDHRAASGMRREVNQLENLTDRLKAQENSPAFARLEHAADQLKVATDRLARNPNDMRALRIFEAKTDKLYSSIKDLKGEMDPATFRSLEQSGRAFESAADRMLQRGAKGPHALARGMQNFANKLDGFTDNLANIQLPNETAHSNWFDPNCGEPLRWSRHSNFA